MPISRRNFLLTSAIVSVAAYGKATSGRLGLEKDPFIEDLIVRMTLEEKAGQLHMENVLTPRMIQPNFQKINPFTPNFTPEVAEGLLNDQLARIRAGAIGFMTSPEDIDSTILAQKTAVEETRLKIPLLFGADIIHGHQTVFPVPIAEAASFEPELARQTARACALEATSNLGLDMTYAPMVDIARDQRWGRVVEGAGEDVLLGARFAAARVSGFQGESRDDLHSLLACVKHFAAYGAAESGLDYAGTAISERVLAEVYLPPFSAAFDAGAIVTMAAFNTIDGEPSTGSHHLLTEILRGQLGFSGAVLSDFQSELELIKHGFAADEKDAARLALSAGCDIGMASGIFPRYVPELVRAGQLDESVLDQAVRRILLVKREAGLFDDPFRRISEQRARSPAPSSHRKLAREAATKSVVMLKNDDNLLPLPSSGKRIALIGPFAADQENLDGPWSPFVPERPSVPLVDGIRGIMQERANLNVVKGCDIEASIAGGIDEAVNAAREADVVILALGESTDMSGESASRTEITVPPAQQDLAEAVSATGKPVVVVLRNGRALALDGAVRDAQAILVGWFLGTETGPALADLIFGKVSPSGRLPMTFPLASGQQPFYYARESSGRPPQGDSTTKFTSHFLDIPQVPLYAFGHGLGYAEVEYGPTQCNASNLNLAGSLDVSATITNQSRRWSAEEVVQLYIHDRVASLVQPVRKMVDFKKIKLAPGKSETVTFTLTAANLSFLKRDLQPTVEPGEFDVWIAPSAEKGTPTTFNLIGA
ncbi:beta-glucosidase [Parahaliea maris]|uniref:beta-glucosidase n=2 Tax=Parahaliea maris TaxID=2716870 RepID=A0A5C8ZXI9_9GAMM|nr:beta-glucosidase [Parahaliea maris]